MDECIYFTRRKTDEASVTAWAFRKRCVKCKKGDMVKPLKGGKPDKKADVYVCSNCNYQESNDQVEEEIVLNVEYSCPYCFSQGETTTEYKRKSFQGVPSYVFTCQKCGKKIGITKKMKDVKRSGED